MVSVRVPEAARKHIRSFIEEFLKPKAASDAHGFLANQAAEDALMREVVGVVQKHWVQHMEEKQRISTENQNSNGGVPPVVKDVPWPPVLASEISPSPGAPAATPGQITDRTLQDAGHMQPKSAADPDQPIKAAPPPPSPASMSAPTPPAIAPPAPPPQASVPPTQISFRLDNGKVGIEYSAKPIISGTNAGLCNVSGVEFPADIGLSWDAATGVIRGTPIHDGCFDIKIGFTLGSPEKTLVSKTELVINPDPKSLWKDLPSNQEDPYWKADEDSMHLQGDNALMVAASKRGRSHAHVGSFRDDDFLLSYLPDGQWHIALVSDGAGSAKFSRRGSQIICHDGGKHLKELLSGEGGMQVQQATEALHQAQGSGASTDAAIGQLRNALYTTIGYTAHHVAKALLDEVQTRQELGGTFKDYSSTALIGLCRRFPFGVLCATYWVGDGAVAVMRNDHGMVLLGESDSGEFSGQTRFLDPAEVTQEALLKRIRFELVDDFKAMVLMTDGISDPFFETEANLENHTKWVSLWDELDAKAQIEKRDGDVAVRLLDWLDFWSPGNHDDRTIAAIY